MPTPCIKTLRCTPRVVGSIVPQQSRNPSESLSLPPVMKAVFFRSFSCLLFCLAALRSHGDLLVQAPTSATAGVEVELEYFSSHTLPPDGQFHQTVVILDEQVIAQGSDPSGT